MSPQEVKLRCGRGILDVNILWGHESKSYSLYDIIIYFDESKCLAGRFCSNFWGDTRISSMVHLGSLKLLCLKETKLEPFISLLYLTEFLYIDGRAYTWLTLIHNYINSNLLWVIVFCFLSAPLPHMLYNSTIIEENVRHFWAVLIL